MILDYNASKGGVHIFDQNLEKFSCRQKTVRWPFLFFFIILDAAANNAYILLQKNVYKSSRKDFLKKLTLDLAIPSIQSRLCKLKVQNSMREAAVQMGISTPAVTRGLQHSLKPNLPKRCTVCKKKSCDSCKKPAYPQHCVTMKICKYQNCVSD